MILSSKYSSSRKRTSGDVAEDCDGVESRIECPYQGYLTGGKSMVDVQTPRGPVK